MAFSNICAGDKQFAEDSSYCYSLSVLFSIPSLPIWAHLNLHTLLPRMLTRNSLF